MISFPNLYVLFCFVFTYIGYPGYVPGFNGTPGPYGSYCPSTGQYMPSPGGQFASMQPHQLGQFMSPGGQRPGMMNSGAPMTQRPQFPALGPGQYQSPGAPGALVRPGQPYPGQQQMAPPPPPPRPPSPMFVTVPPRTQRLLHSEAYLKYIEGLNAESQTITEWEKTFTATPENTPCPDESRLPGHWLAQGAVCNGPCPLRLYKLTGEASIYGHVDCASEWEKVKL
ncbi:hypothetical protein DPMN_118633 [Dreissena polymorpha]|uniref:Uncharacterized protein n=1 Tax=Dreissena polymorpha TaxID=45954 RepID=A0A9D4GH58_DREPO|nr:hypothetical protein DPMN_118633 [Dreissena polymorpha]